MLSRGNPEEREEIPQCPICGCDLTVSCQFAKLKICRCRECGTSLSIPDEARDRIRLMRRDERETFK